MYIKKISDQLSVADQITQKDVSVIAKAGFKSIVCNRPDGEDLGQPAFKEIEQAAIKANLPIRFLPAVSGAVTSELGQEFGKLLEDLPKPVLAYCRSGMRCTTLWALSNAKTMDRASLVRTAANAGYDISAISL
ncbi:MAG: TIGR01244 family phosphatase [Burkholderiales bacterium]|nr:TIGR01244 family phosphatase [Burkholderiales bacterium]